MRSRTTLLVSIGMGILAVLLMLVYVTQRESQLLQLSEMKDVVIATADILPNTILDERIVQRIQVPAKYKQPKALGDLREVVGRVVQVPVPKGAQVLGTYLEDEGRTALSYEVPRGRRAVTLAVSDVTGVAGLLRPSNVVDVLGTFEYGKPTGSVGGQMQYSDEKTETRVLLQNVPVIAVAQEHRGARPEAMRSDQAQSLTEQAQEEARTRARTEVRNVTVIVPLAEVQQLVLAQQIGTLTLALRSTLDAGQVDNLAPLDPLGLLHVPIPLKQKAGPTWREMRGAGNGF
jgi:pilus assembly protein CpaB